MRAAPTLVETSAGATASTRLMTAFGEFALHGFRDPRTGSEHAALVLGDVGDTAPVLTRMHSECLTGDGLFSLQCDCGAQLRRSLQLIAQEKRGVLLYLRQEGRGIGLVNKIRAYELQRAGRDTVDANRALGLPDDARDYRMAADMLRRLDVRQVRLLTNNPAKIAALVSQGIDVVERVALHAGHTPFNSAYMATKRQRMGHLAPH
jgi:GTP cyclohydrolase II